MSMICVRARGRQSILLPSISSPTVPKLQRNWIFYLQLLQVADNRGAAVGIPSGSLGKSPAL